MTESADGGVERVAGAPAQERVWTIVPPPSGGLPVFAVLCALLPLVAAWVVFISSVSISALAIGTGFLAAIQVGVLGLERFCRPPREVRVGPDGVRAGQKLAAWDRITKISWVPGRRQLAIVYGGRVLYLPAHHVVPKEVVPEIIGRLPGVEVTKGARRALEDPDRLYSVSPRAKTAKRVVILTVGVILALLPVLVRYISILWLLAFTLVLMILLALGVPATPWPHADPQRPKAGLLHLYAAVLPLVYLFVWFLDVPLRSMDALAAMVVILYLVAIVSPAFGWNPKAWARGAAVCLAVAIPFAVYYAEKPFDLKRTEITSLLGPGLHGGPVAWSPHGSWIMADTMGESPVLIDMSALRSWELPFQKHSSMMPGVGSLGAVRYARLDRTRDLFFYRFEDRREVELSVGMKIRVVPGRCISPSGGIVCWLATTESNDPQPSFVMVHDVRARATRPVNIAWPEANDIEWEACWWIDDQTIAVRGQSPRRNWGGWSDSNSLTSLHLLRVDYPSGNTQHMTPSEEFREWVLSPDARHAFVRGSTEDSNREDIWYMDIASGQKTPMAGSSIPRWQQDGRAAWRVTDAYGDGEWLCRFQVESAKEEPVLRIPPGSWLESLSPRGRFAILYDGMFRVRPLRLVQVATGNDVRLNDASICAVLGLMVDSRGGSTGSPWIGQPCSIWSPDEARFAVPSFLWAPKMENLSLRIFLYEVPPAWLK